MQSSVNFPPKMPTTIQENKLCGNDVATIGLGWGRICLEIYLFQILRIVAHKFALIILCQTFQFMHVHSYSTSLCVISYTCQNTQCGGL